MPHTPSQDRRVQKTRAHLLGALGSLLHEKPYDAIVVKEILHRANVARSTFYTHFSDKDDLLSSAIADLLASARTPTTSRGPERVLRFSLPVLEHIDRSRRSLAGGGRGDGVGARGRRILHERLVREIAERVEEEVRRGPWRRDPGGMPPELLARHVAATFATVLDWWVASPSDRSPAEVDALFRALVMPALSACLA